MRLAVLVLLVPAVSLLSAAAMAQEAAPAPDKTYISATDVQAMIAAKKAGTLVSLAPLRAGLEYRTGPQTALVHQEEAEFIYVIEGSGTMILGGTLDNAKPNRPGNLAGSGITDGAHLKLQKGAIIFVPAGTPHQFTDIDGALSDLAFHVPRGTPAPADTAKDKTFASADDVKAAIGAKKNGTLAAVAPYTVPLQYRVTGPQRALVHPDEAELDYMIEGTGVLTIGGTLNSDKTGIIGGTELKMEPGAVVLIPQNTPHQFTTVNGMVANLELHVPRGAKPAP